MTANNAAGKADATESEGQLLTGFVTSFFFVLQFISPPWWYIERHRDGTDARERQIVRFVEGYILLWLILEVVMLLAHFLGRPLIEPVVQFLVIWRVVDITQSVLNRSVFDQIRFPSKLLWSSGRSLVLGVVNFAELLLLFALIYLSLPGELVHAGYWADALYFSVITQLSIGYGDIYPIHAAKLAASIQGLLGWLFTVIIIGRFLASLPLLGAARDQMAPNSLQPASGTEKVGNSQ